MREVDYISEIGIEGGREGDRQTGRQAGRQIVKKNFLAKKKRIEEWFIVITFES